MLKRLFAITLLIVHLFNLTGYAILFEYFMARSDLQLVKQLDANQYSDHELFVVKVPLYVPYLANRNEYERVDGEMQVDGVYYNYVKRKVSNDTLFLLCVPNKDKTHFYHARNEYGKQANGIPAGEENSRSLIKKINISSEYNQPVLLYAFTSTAEPMIAHCGYPVDQLIDVFTADTYKPPRIKHSMLLN
ncbi:MAG: hypothetical protein J7621_04605 [Niastella sp.]|nr:hypothetical protein [Niastella sp.]